MNVQYQFKFDFEKGSPIFSLSKEDWKKIGKGFLLCVSGGLLTMLADWLQAFSDTFDFGIYEMISVAIFSTLVNIIRKWVTDTTQG